MIADCPQETERVRQQIAVVVDQLALVKRGQETQAAEFQSAQRRNAVLEQNLAEQKRQTQHWQGMAQQRLAEAERMTARQREVEQTIAVALDQLALVQRNQTTQMAELQAAEQQNATLAEELVNEQRQTQHWHDMAQQKAAEIERMAVERREAEQETGAIHQQEADRLRQQLAALQAAEERNTALAEELVDEKRQTQHWQETAQQKTAEIERMAVERHEVERTAAANHRQEADRLRQQISELAEQQVLAEGRQAAEAAELQAARQQNVALREELAEQKRLTQRWQETAEQKAAEIERIAVDRREVAQTTAASHQQETERLRRQIAEMNEQQSFAERRQIAQADQLQVELHRNAALTEELADQSRQTLHWQETAERKLAEIEAMAVQQRQVEQTTAASHEQETNRLRQQIAELTQQQSLAESRQTAQEAELQAASRQSAALADELTGQKHQAQHWQETAEQKLAEIEAAAAQQREAELAAASCKQETGQLRQQIAELLDQLAMIRGEQAGHAAELQAARDRNQAMEAELADQKLQSQRWQEIVECARQATDLRTMVEHEQAYQAASKEAAGVTSSSADSEARPDRRESASIQPPVPLEHIAWETPPASEVSGPATDGKEVQQTPARPSKRASLTARHQAQWEELLRIRSQTRK